MKTLTALLALLTASPALAAVECNTVPGPGDFRIRFSTENADYGLRKLHQDWIEKKTGKVNRKTSMVLRLSAGPQELAIRTVPNTDNAYKHLSYIEINGAPAGANFKAEVKWWSLRSGEGNLIPRWQNEGISELSCIVD